MYPHYKQYFLFILHTKHTQNLFEKTEIQTFSGVCLSLFMPQWKEILMLCTTLINIILRVFVLNNSDRKNDLECLRRQEKLTK